MILSWDVGIINLDYYILEKIGNGCHDFKTHGRGKICIGDDKYICCEKLNNNTPCKSIATYIHDDKYYCKKHLSKIEKYVVCVNEPLSIKCEHITNEETNKQCNKKTHHSIDGISYCVTHAKMHEKYLTQQNNPMLIKKTNANEQKIRETTIKLINILDTHDEFMECKEVLIENQPAMKNPVMKRIATTLYTYFIMKSSTTSKHPNCKITNVKFICPSNKLKLSPKTIQQINDTDNERKAYILTKQMSVHICLALLKCDPDTKNDIMKLKKKDDTCDAMLQAYYYAFCLKNGINEDLHILVEEVLNSLAK